MSSRVVCTCLQIRRFSHTACRGACVEHTACIEIYAFGLTHRCDPLNPHHQRSTTIVTTTTMQFSDRRVGLPLQLLSPPPVAAMWKDYNQPDWTTRQSQRLEDLRDEQWRQRETWEVAEKERRKWSQWEEDNTTWHFVEGHWTWMEWKYGGEWHWTNETWWKEELAAFVPTGASSSRWQEDEDEENLTPEQVHADLGHHRWMTTTPVSFQPQRHVFMVLGRPVVVLLCSEMQWPFR